MILTVLLQLKGSELRMNTQILGVNEFEILEDKLKDVLQNNFSEILSRINYSGQLMELLSILGLENLLPSQMVMSNKQGKIIVIGQSEVKESKLLAVAKELGLDKRRFEFCLDYDKAKNFSYTKMQYSSNYCLVMIGAVPHRVKNKGCFSSIISKMEQQEGYPPIVRMGNNELKITKSGFERTLKDLLNKGLL